MIKAKAFLAIELALTEQFASAVSQVTDTLYHKISGYVEQGKFTEAREQVKNLVLDDVYDQMESSLLYQTNLAMLFGASRVTRNPGTSAVGLGFEQLMVQQLVASFRNLIRQTQTQLQGMALQLIAQLESGLAVVQKGNPYHDKDGKFTSKDKAVTYAVSDGVTVNGQSVKVTVPKGYDHLTMINVDAFDKQFKKAKGYYVGEGGVGGATGRYKGFELYFKGGKDTESIPGMTLDVPIAKEMEASIVSISKEGKVDFVNGRHRYAWLRDQGLKTMPVAMDDESVKNGKKNGLVVIEQKAEKRIIRDFQSFMDAQGKVYFNMVASLHTSRVSAYGFTAEADALGLEEYQINEQLDVRTCKVCRKMHGKVFPIQPVKDFLDVVVRLDNPEALKALQPWPKQNKETLEQLDKMTPEQLIARGWHTPPFHPRCRGLLGVVGKVAPLNQLLEGEDKDQVKASKEEFKMLGIPITDAQFEKWNSNLNGIPLSLLLSVISGKKIDEILAKAVLGENVHQFVGLKAFQWVEDGLKLSFEEQDFWFKFLKKSVGLWWGQDVSSRKIKRMIRNAYRVGVDSGMLSLSIPVDAMESEVWVKRGFLPNDWNGVREKIKKNYLELSNIGVDDRGLIEEVLSSSQPSALIDLFEFSGWESLLKGVAWAGEIIFDNMSQMKGLMSYLKTV